MFSLMWVLSSVISTLSILAVLKFDPLSCKLKKERVLLLILGMKIDRTSSATFYLCNVERVEPIQEET